MWAQREERRESLALRVYSIWMLMKEGWVFFEGKWWWWWWLMVKKPLQWGHTHIEGRPKTWTETREITIKMKIQDIGMHFICLQCKRTRRRKTQTTCLFELHSWRLSAPQPSPPGCTGSSNPVIHARIVIIGDAPWFQFNLGLIHSVRRSPQKVIERLVSRGKKKNTCFIWKRW